MQQIRARIREKRGVDYTEQQIRELATVKLEKFLDPRGVRSDLLEQFRRRSGAEPPSRRTTRSRTRRSSRRIAGSLRLIRRLLQPDPEAVLQPEPARSRRCTSRQLEQHQRASSAAQREQLDALYYEVIHNLVLEMTRLGIEVEEPEDARRVAVEPARLQRAPRARARRRRAVPARRRPAARSRRPAATAAAAAATRAAPPAHASGSARRQAPRHRPRSDRPAQPARGRRARTGSEPRRRRRRAGGRRRPALPRTGDAGATAASAEARADGDHGRGQRRRGSRVEARRPSTTSTTASDIGSRTSRESDRSQAPAPTTGDRRRSRRSVKLAVVVQRYGADINGGAELHARYIAEHLARHAEVEVLTTCATRLRDVAQRAAGRRRARSTASRCAAFRVKHERDPHDVRPAVATASSSSATRSPTSSTGSTRRARPARRSSTTSPGTPATFDFFLFFSYRYYHAYHGARAVPDTRDSRADGRARSRRSACRSSSRSSAASARSCTTRPRSGR